MEKETQQTQVLDHKLPAVQGDRGEKTVKDDDYVRII